MSPEAFVARWEGREGGAERANYALFLTDLTEALDLPRPEPADSASRYRFEYPVQGDFGQKLRIDLYKEGAFILEAKQSRLAVNPHRRHAKHEAVVQEDLFPTAAPAAPRRARWSADMTAAFRQARDYAQRLEAHVDRPPFLITCDVGATFAFHADFTGQGRAYRPFTHKPTGLRVVTLPDLLIPEVRTLFQQVWTEPKTLDPATERARVTRDVAAHLAEVSRALEARGHAREEVATFLGRLLFAMFAEDVGLLPPAAFSGLLARCVDSPATFMGQASDLFARMDEGGFSAGLGAQLRRFNGAFYKDRRAFPLEREEIGALIEAAKADWREVEPAIFGTLLEQALDPKERGRLGAHYTPRPYVERLVQATVMQPLRADWDDARAAAEARREAGDAEGARLELLAFHDQLTRTRVLDPACGTGNFLYVALELMKALEGEVRDARAALEGEGEIDPGLVSPEFERGVDPRRFLGLELNPRAAAIAELVLWIGYLQASYRRDPAYDARTPVLEDYGNIRLTDAVVARRDAPPPGEDRRPDWPEAEFIVGNPPFIGGKDIRAELGDDYAEALWAAHRHMNPSADFVMYWWDRAADILTRKGSKLRRFGLVTTNSVTQVFQRRTVARWLSADNPNKRALGLIFAVGDHPWTKATRDAAAVRIAMTAAEVGAREGELLTLTPGTERKLDTDQPAFEVTIERGPISADLTVGVDVTRAVELKANAGLCSPGVKLHGAGFIVTSAEARLLGLAEESEPAAADGKLSPGLQRGGVPRRGLERHIRPYRNGRDLTGRSRGVMVIDLFGLTAEQVRERYPEVYQHVARTVKPERDANNRATYRDNWWVFGEPRRELRPALVGLRRYIATVETSKHRTFTFVDEGVLPDNKLIAIASENSAHLAVLSSDLHVTWALATGGWLGVGNDPVYVKSRCFDPFPFPAWTEAQRAALADAGEALDGFRKARLAELPDLTLTRMYNALEAHRAGKVPEQGREDSMTAQEAGDFTRASVVVLAELHDTVDRLTLEAYGWGNLARGRGSAAVPTGAPRHQPPTGEGNASDQALLGRLLALNAERAAAEARGERPMWLRPDYQASRARGVAAGRETAALDLAADAAPAGKARWPAKPRYQVLEIKTALAEAAAPLPPAALAARFSGRAAARDVPRLLGALERSGQVRRVGPGYLLLRAA